MRRGFDDPEIAKKANRKSHEKWIENGRKPRGFAARPDIASQAGIKSVRKARKNQTRNSESKD